jgi:predicted nuclease with TOPRIM domain
MTKEDICSRVEPWFEHGLDWRSKLKEEVERLIEDRTDECEGLRAERDKLREEVWRLKLSSSTFYANTLLIEVANVKLTERVSELEGALEKIKFRTLPGTTSHELAKEALSRTSEGRGTLKELECQKTR